MRRSPMIRNSSVLLVASILFQCAPALADVAVQLKPRAETRRSFLDIDNTVYARCTKKVLEALGPPHGTAAHFTDMWIAFSFRCAAGDGESW